MKFFELNLENSKLMLTQFAPNTSDPGLHDHGGDYQISIPLVGSPFVEYNRDTRYLDNEVRLVTPPGEQHRHFAYDEAGRVLLINLNASFLENVLRDKLGFFPEKLELTSWGEGSSDGFRKLADTMMRLSMTSTIERTELEEIEWRLACLLLSVQTGNHTHMWRQTVMLSNHPLLQRAVEFIHANYQRELSLDDIAEASGLSKYHFIRLFHEMIGSTPSHYLTTLRLHHAETKLRKSGQDITSIAFDVGFGSLATFERAFRNHYGVSPSRYRAEC